MTLIPEDGSGRPDANAYADVAYADAWHAARGNGAWAAAGAPERAAALVRATDFLDATQVWRGERATVGQGLAWPRRDALDDAGHALAGLPEALRRACAELALTALSELLLPDEHRGGRISSESVGPLSTTYAEGAPAGTVRRMAEGLLRQLVRGGNDLVRA